MVRSLKAYVFAPHLRLISIRFPALKVKQKLIETKETMMSERASERTRDTMKGEQQTAKQQQNTKLHTESEQKKLKRREETKRKANIKDKKHKNERKTARERVKIE